MKRMILLVIGAMISTLALQSQHLRNVVLYDLTSTNCGPCTCMDSILRVSIIPGYPRTIPICVHSPLPFGSFYNNYRGKEIYVTFKSQYEPSGFLDGTGSDHAWAVLEPAVDERYTYNNETQIGIVITNKQWEPASRQVQLSVDITNDGESLSGTFRCQIFVTENNLVHIHRTANGCSTPNDPHGLPFDSTYINNFVIRAVEFIPDSSTAEPHWGEELITSFWTAGEKVSKTWTIGIDTGWIEANCFINLIIYQDNEDSLYKSPHLQGLNQSVTGGVGIDPSPAGDLNAGILQIFPNPAAEWVRVHVAVEKPGVCSLEIFDMEGKRVLRTGSSFLATGLYNMEIMISELASGHYICRFQTPEGESTGKLIVSK